MLTIDRTTPDPIPVGDRVSGHATWRPQTQGSPRELRVSLCWRTEGRGDTDRATVAELRLPIVGGDSTSLPFDFTVPPDGPVTYNGKLLRIIWEIVVQLDVAMSRDPRIMEPLVVVPRYV